MLWGRLYCGRICAYGALTQLLDPIVPNKYRYDIPFRIERHANKIKYVILAGVVLYFFATRDMSIYRYVEPFWLFGGQASTACDCARRPAFATNLRRNLYCRSCARSARRWGCSEGDDLRISAGPIAQLQICATCRGADRRADIIMSGACLRRLRALT